MNWTHQPGSKVAVVADGLRMVADLVRIRQNAARGLYNAPRLGVHPADDSVPNPALSDPGTSSSARERIYVAETNAPWLHRSNYIGDGRRRPNVYCSMIPYISAASVRLCCAGR